MSVERRFTVDEANSMLEEIAVRLERIRDVRARLIRSARLIEERVSDDGGGVEGKDWFEAQAILRSEVEALISGGVILRDPESGLVDFPAERDGDEIFLCWKSGEPAVSFWHGQDSGFAGRRHL